MNRRGMMTLLRGLLCVAALNEEIFRRILIYHPMLVQKCEKRPDGRQFPGNGALLIALVQIPEESSDVQGIHRFQGDLLQSLGVCLHPVRVAGDKSRHLNEIMAVCPQCVGRVSLFSRQIFQKGVNMRYNRLGFHHFNDNGACLP